MILVCVIMFLASIFCGIKFQNWVEKESKKNEKMDLQRAMILAYRRQRGLKK